MVQTMEAKTSLKMSAPKWSRFCQSRAMPPARSMQMTYSLMILKSVGPDPSTSQAGKRPGTNVAVTSTTVAVA
ncbi:hypothetical protein MKMG_01630 [Methanogenium sp. MK-MG]|nr:hypothetical protein MKMG_01630 [Methanogenium sp. MK-MG]